MESPHFIRYSSTTKYHDASVVDTSIPLSPTPNGYPTSVPTYGGGSSTHHTTHHDHSSSSPTTFATSTTATPDPYSSPSSPSGTAVPSRHHSSLSTGSLVAAILIPILVVLVIALLVFYFLRRRSHQPRSRSDSGGTLFLPAWREKWGSPRSSGSSAKERSTSSETGPLPVVTGAENHAYYTGLDTSSHGGSSRHEGRGSADIAQGRRSDGGTTFEVAPPPYHVNQSGMRGDEAPALPPLTEPSGMGLDASHFATSVPPSWSHSILVPCWWRSDDDRPADLLAVPLDPPQSSSRSARSITSTLYSDTASIHSARAARRSIGPQVIASAGTAGARSRNGSGSTNDPFHDPHTPVTPLSSLELEHRTDDENRDGSVVP